MSKFKIGDIIYNVAQPMSKFKIGDIIYNVAQPRNLYLGGQFEVISFTKRGDAVAYKAGADSFSDTLIHIVRPNDWELVPPPKKKGSGWVNVYQVGESTIWYSNVHPTKETAIRMTERKYEWKLLATVEVSWEEGQGLES